MLGWDQYGFHKNCNGTRSVEILFLHPVGCARHVVHSVRPGRETSMHYFSCSGGTSMDLTKSALGHVVPNLCFLHPEGSAGNVVHFCASSTQNVDVLFFMLQWDRYGFDKKRFRTHYAELVFLHPLGSVGHVVHSGASEARNVDTLFFMLGWDRYRIHKKLHWDTLRRTFVFASGGICGSHSAFRAS
jgi:hypothetical protein